MSEKSNNIRQQIIQIVGEGPLGKKVMDYINSKLDNQTILIQKDIKNIVNPIVSPIILNKNYKQLLFLLKENIPLGRTFSFFDPSITENIYLKNKVVMPKGMSRTWNIFNDNKFESLRKKLIFIERNSDMLNNILQKSKFTQYKNSFNFGSNNSNLIVLIDELIDSNNIVEREMSIYNFIGKYGEKRKIATTFYLNANGNSYETIGKGNNRDHAFTYLFEKLYESIEDKLWSESMKAYKASVRRNINKIGDNKKKISTIRGLINKLQKDSHYNTKLTFLKRIQRPIIVNIEKSKLSKKQRKQKNKNNERFGKKANPTLSNVLKANRKINKRNKALNNANSAKLNA
jgi:hypothetical protein